MGTTWSFAIDGPDATAVVDEARLEAHRLGREIVGAPSVAEVVDPDGESKWWVSIYVERARTVH
jgi:hypothetical protein